MGRAVGQITIDGVTFNSGDTVHGVQRHEGTALAEWGKEGLWVEDGLGNRIKMEGRRWAWEKIERPWVPNDAVHTRGNTWTRSVNVWKHSVTDDVTTDRTVDLWVGDGSAVVLVRGGRLVGA